MILGNKYIGKSTFRLGIAYIKFPSGQIDNSILTDPSYFSVSFSNTEYRRSSEGFELTPNFIPYGDWNDTFSDIVRKNYLTGFHLTSIYVLPLMTII